MPIDNPPIHSEKLCTALVSMPWSIYNRPSIQLGVLKSYLQHHDPALDIGCFHHFLEVAKAIGPETYHWLTLSGWGGEALYAPIVFPEMHNDAATLFEGERKKFKRSKVESGFDTLRLVVLQALKEWVDSVSWEQYGLIGFSVCFNQLLPSLAAAQLIKQRVPTARIVFGGSACGGMAGSDLAKNFDQVDHVIRGEGENSLLGLILDLCEPEKENVKTVIDPPGSYDLKEMPEPDYRDYFHELTSVFSGMPVNAVIPVEFSRGCWWGKCTFCNLNLQWCGYRFKTADQMFAEVENLAGDFDCLDFSFTDNVLPVVEARKFFRKIEDGQKDYSFFAEIRATQLDDLAEYRRGGVTVVQAGIESLSTSLLAKMNKGITSIENLAVMKKAQQEGLCLEGNLITEFPGSTEGEVLETLRCLEFSLPFQPLKTASFFLGLDSPVDQCPGNYSIRVVGAHKNYYRLYPRKILQVQEMLVKDHRGSKGVQHRLWQPVVKHVNEWNDFHRQRGNQSQSPLSYRDGGSFIVIRQEQLAGPVLIHKLKGLSRKIYLFCEEIQELEKLGKKFPMVSGQKLHVFLNEMVDKKLMFRECDKFLSLAVHSRKTG